MDFLIVLFSIYNLTYVSETWIKIVWNENWNRNKLRPVRIWIVESWNLNTPLKLKERQSIIEKGEKLRTGRLKFWPSFGESFVFVFIFGFSEQTFKACPSCFFF